MIELNNVEKNSQKWVLAFLAVSILLLTICAGINYLIDPLWIFTHTNSWNEKQFAINERQQKTNRLAFTDFDYNAIILGSSLVAGINQYDFKGMKAFNYSSNSLKTEDYAGYIEYCKQRAGKPLKYIVLGIDFFTTNYHLKLSEKEPAHYILKTRDPLYRLSTLLSLDTLKYSYRNYHLSSNPNIRYYYDRRNVKTLKVFPPGVKENEMKKLLLAYRDQTFANYQYKHMLGIFQQLKQANPESQFIVFTPPISARAFRLIMKLGLFPFYVQWLKDAVTVFGDVHHFMDIHSISEDINKFQEGIHFFADTGQLIAHKVSGFKNDAIPEDFGVLLRRENFLDVINSTVTKLKKR